MNRGDRPILRVRDLEKHYAARGGFLSPRRGVLKAVDGVSFDVGRGETLGLVGESGCGKTTLCRVVLRLTPATGGGVLFDGDDLFAMNGRQLRIARRRMQIVFQDPAGSLNPRMTLGDIVAEPLRIHRVAGGPALRRQVAELLERVGLSADDAVRYPHEISGGQRQRVGIARAIALKPSLIVCDEPVSALDVSIQSQILNLLADLRDEFELSYLFVAHDLAVVRHFCDAVAVMYLGKIVEIGPCDEIYDRPRHPYTRALLAAVPKPHPTDRREHAAVRGEVADPANPPGGCAFHPRCPIATERCALAEPLPEPKPGLDSAHLVACHHADDAPPIGEPAES